MEGDAGTSRLNPTDPEDASTSDVAASDAPAAPVAASAGDNDEVTEEATESTEEPLERSDEAVTTVPAGPTRRTTRLGRGWALSACAGLAVLAAATGVGGYLALQGHRDSADAVRAEDAAVAAAKDCVAATQAPDSAAMVDSQRKIVECATGDFGAQATLYSGMLVEAYQAAQVSVKVSDLRAAAERHNEDGSVDVLVAVRVKVTNADAADQEQGYRLRVKMAPADGTYKIARLDQVTS
jgi:Mce-associated membrane protein